MNITKNLRIIYFIELLTPILLTVIFEIENNELNGHFEGDSLMTYWMQIVGVFLTIGAIPLALKWMKLVFVKHRIQGNKLEYLRLSIFRIAILGVPLLYNTLAYYLLGFDPTCGYLALICFVAFFFIWPSDARMNEECELIYDQKEE